MTKLRSAFPKPIYLSASVRTPIGRFGGSLKHLSASELATFNLKACMERVAKNLGEEASKTADYVFMGHARQAGARPNPARQAAIFSGLPHSTPAMTLNQACASGLQSVISGAQLIALGRAKRVYAGGVESMSNTPYLLMNARFGMRMGHQEVLDGMHQDGFFCPMSGMVMGQTVETFLAKELQISREEQDAYALMSQQRADEAWKKGLFTSEISVIPEMGKNPGLAEDEHRRGSTTLDSLKKLPPVFEKTGTITAGNSSGITDGAAFLSLSAELHAGVEVELLDDETVSLDPKKMGLGPVPAVMNLLKRNGLSVQDLDCVELNEAFAAQVIACQRELKIPMERLNPRGGSIALGHPIGATGTRILTTLIHQLKGKSGALGVATLCVSGGHGVAVLVRAV